MSEGKPFRRAALGAAIFLVAAGCVVAGFLAGRIASPAPAGSEAPDASAVDAVPAGEAIEYTCSMHPSVRQPGPGDCPICGMDLIPVAAGDGGQDAGVPRLEMSPAALALAEVRTTAVERRFAEVEAPMVGKVALDETRVGRISAWFPGRIDRLFVNYTGIAVREGDHMVEIYSPQLQMTQNELILAAQAAREDSAGRTLSGLLKSARERLRLWGMTPGQIESVERMDEAPDKMVVYAPMGGIVVEKNVVEGAYVDTGERLFTIADLSRLWVNLEAYEPDVAWVRYGQSVEFEVAAWPGRAFEGVVAFIDPVLDERTRTVQVRLNVDNAEGLLKPGMFVRATLRAKIAEGGQVVDTSLAGKWISPMHPEVIKDEPGTCDVCGMPLESAESLGYVTDSQGLPPPLVIPASAPLITGKRAVVYVESPENKSVFEGREVVLGPRAGDHYVVAEGLEEGERVVTHGNFKIDSALQIQAKPSMMQAPSEQTEHAPHEPDEADAGPSAPDGVETSPAARAHMDALLAPYFAVQEALADDDLEAAAAAAQDLLEAAAAIPMADFTGGAHEVWMAQSAALKEAASALAGESENMGRARTAFKAVSEAMIRMTRVFGADARAPVRLAFCPMAFDDRGAEWLQSGEEIRNPYFGSQMLKCGEIRETFEAP